jgi:hypothetical protein
MRYGRTALALAIACGLVAGCDKGGDSATPGSEASVSAGSAAKGPDNWNAADACSILDKTTVGEILKQDVTEAQLGLVNEASTTAAATSECTYANKDGEQVASLMTRWSPINDNQPATIAMAKQAAAASVKAFTDLPIEDVPGLGKAAFIVPKIDALNVFIDDARLIIVTPRKVPDGILGKDVAIALAKKAGA